MTVSIIIPTWNRPELLLTRSLPSALGQTFTDLDIHIVGDGCSPEVEQAIIAGIPADRRIRYTNIERQAYSDDAVAAWNVRGSQAINYGLDEAKGEWVTTLGDDDELTTDSIEVLLNAATINGWDLVYGRSEIVGHGFLGDGNPRHAGQTNHMLWRQDDTRMDLDCYKLRRIPNDWDLMSRLIQNHHWGFIPVVVYRYYPVDHVPGSDPI